MGVGVILERPGPGEALGWGPGWGCAAEGANPELFQGISGPGGSHMGIPGLGE